MLLKEGFLVFIFFAQSLSLGAMIDRKKKDHFFEYEIELELINPLQNRTSLVEVARQANKLTTDELIFYLNQSKKKEVADTYCKALIRKIKKSDPVLSLKKTGDVWKICNKVSDEILNSVFKKHFAKHIIPSVELNGAGINLVAWLPDGSKLAAEISSIPARTCLLNSDNGRLIRNFGSKLLVGSSLAWSSNGKTLSVGTPKEIVVQGSNKMILDILDIKWESNGKNLVAVYSNGVIRKWNSDKKKILSSTKMNFDRSNLVTLSPGGTKIAIGSSESNGGIGATKNNVGVAFLQKKDKLPVVISNLRATALAWSPDGNRLAIGKCNGRTYVYDLSKRLLSLLFSVKNETPISVLAWSPDGQRVAVGGGPHDNILIVDSDTRALLSDIKSLGTVKQLEWSPRGGKIASVTSEGRAFVWNLNVADLSFKQLMLVRAIGAFYEKYKRPLIITKDTKNPSILKKIFPQYLCDALCRKGYQAFQEVLPEEFRDTFVSLPVKMINLMKNSNLIKLEDDNISVTQTRRKKLKYL